MSKGKNGPRAAKGCAGVTLAGGQCSRRAVEGSTFCRQHGEGSGKLTEKQLRFIDEYLIDLNGAGAARRAGYSLETARTIANQNLTKLDIREAIEKRLAELAMGKAEVLRRLADQARGSLEPFLVDDVSRPGKVRLDLSTEDAKLARGLIKKVKIKTLRIGPKAVEETVEVELYDAQAALVHLGKAHALFVERQEVSGPEGGPVEVVTTLDVSKLSDAALDELDELLAGE